MSISHACDTTGMLKLGSVEVRLPLADNLLTYAQT